ncbi:MAG TPA: hypothetical protein VFF27_16540 [Bacteroidia bacterium]|nr:hypothetical protein [Bacteroidia bacterium]
MKKTITLFAIAAVVLMGSCKKKDDVKPEEETTTPTEENINGSLTMITQEDVGSNPFPIINTASAIFYENIHSTNYIEVDSVIVNGVGLEHQSLTNMYQAIPNMITNYTKATWEVKGKNGIPSFTYENKRGMPVYTGYAAIPDVISPKKDYTLTLTGVSNTDLYIVSIKDLNGGNLMKNELIGKNSVTFTAAELATMDTDAIIQVTIVNHSTQSLGGKNFSIQNEANYYKEITIN